MVGLSCRAFYLCWYLRSWSVGETPRDGSSSWMWVCLLFLLHELTVFDLAVRNRLWNNGGFFFLVWAVHYLPFFVMNRQLFVHHYLPSHLASALIAGVILSFVLSDTVNYPISVWGAKIRNPKPTQYADIGIKGPVIVAVFSLFLFFMFVYLAPLTYGTPGYLFFPFVM